jgi:hypothetical protein
LKFARPSRWQSRFKEDVGGVSTLPPDRRQHLFRYGIWHDIDPQPRLHFERWLDRWMKPGGIAFRGGRLSQCGLQKLFAVRVWHAEGPAHP